MCVNFISNSVQAAYLEMGLQIFHQDPAGYVLQETLPI